MFGEQQTGEQVNVESLQIITFFGDADGGGMTVVRRPEEAGEEIGGGP
ncbi:hypothetical protein [Geothermobacter hydrogeniphilus]|nr:hypothetical protein [Geothermobacter hydrogeniphilus]